MDTTYPVWRVGRLTFVVEKQGQPVSNDSHFDAFPADIREQSHNVEKLVARFGLHVNGEPLASGIPFFYGSTKDAGELVDVREVAECFLSDVRSIHQNTDATGDDLTRWAAWADDMGAFAGDWSGVQVRQSLRDFQTIRTWESLLLERLTTEEFETAITEGEER